MKKLTIFFITAILALSSCVKNTPGQPTIWTKGLLVLNNGNWGANDASISMYNPETREVSGEVFLNVNGRHIGDLGQDIIAVGEELYIAVNGSQLIYVTDTNLKIKKTLTAQEGDMKLSPRSLIYVPGGKVYVTYYEGYLGEIDPVSNNIRTCTVGANPEGLAYAKGNIYVANSGGYVPGYNNTVSVVDAAKFRETATITVNTNPSNVIASPDGSKIYVNSIGDYDSILPKLEVIDVASKEVKALEYKDVKSIALSKDGILLVVTGGYNEKWEITGTILKHDIATETSKGLFTEETIERYYSISADPASGHVFVGSSDYKTNGDVLLFDESGKLLDRFDSQGLNPQKALYL